MHRGTLVPPSPRTFRSEPWNPPNQGLEAGSEARAEGLGVASCSQRRQLRKSLRKSLRTLAAPRAGAPDRGGLPPLPKLPPPHCSRTAAQIKRMYLGGGENRRRSRKQWGGGAPPAPSERGSHESRKPKSPGKRTNFGRGGGCRRPSNTTGGEELRRPPRKTLAGQRDPPLTFSPADGRYARASLRAVGCIAETAAVDAGGGGGEEAASSSPPLPLKRGQSQNEGCFASGSRLPGSSQAPPPSTGVAIPPRGELPGRCPPPALRASLAAKKELPERGGGGGGGGAGGGSRPRPRRGATRCSHASERAGAPRQRRADLAPHGCSAALRSGRGTSAAGRGDGRGRAGRGEAGGALAGGESGTGAQVSPQGRD